MGALTSQEVFIPGHWPSLNQLLYTNVRQKIRIKRDWANVAMVFMRVAKISPIRDTKVHIAYEHRRPNLKGDPGNFAAGAAKIIEDALVSLKIIENDTFKYIAGFSHDFLVDKKNPGIKVVLTRHGSA